MNPVVMIYCAYVQKRKFARSSRLCHFNLNTWFLEYVNSTASNFLCLVTCLTFNMTFTVSSYLISEWGHWKGRSIISSLVIYQRVLHMICKIFNWLESLLYFNIWIACWINIFRMFMLIIWYISTLFSSFHLKYLHINQYIFFAFILSLLRSVSLYFFYVLNLLFNVISRYLTNNSRKLSHHWIWLDDIYLYIGWRQHGTDLFSFS